MDGFDILKARREAKVSQVALAKRLKLVSRTALTDIESGAVEVTDSFVLKAMGAIQELRAEREQEAA
jgi:DNA-binding XRE family transcriptional regulator